MTARHDISDKLVHFTSGNDIDDAYQRIRKIIDECQLRGSGAMIKGGHDCVCFSEAPLTSLPNGLVNPDAYSRYSPFGIIVEKQWLFQQGGRPVIYQPDSEYKLLPKQLRWRHMNYEPGILDFTWEREWRIQSKKLQFGPHEAGIVVPDRKWADRLVDEHDWEQDLRVLEYSLIMDELLAQQYREKFSWRIYYLK